MLFGALLLAPWHAVAQDFKAGIDAAGRGDYAAAMRQWLPLAEGGNMNAQYNIGHMYEDGLGVARNLSEAAKWWRRAAYAGHPPSQVKLGGLYAQGAGGLRKDTAEAAQLFRSAAERGYSSGQYLFGLMQYHGEGGLRKNLPEAAKWMRLAAEQNHVPAQRMLGLMHRDGEGVDRDMAEAEAWLNRAAELGDAQAKQALGTLPRRQSQAPSGMQATVPVQLTPAASDDDIFSRALVAAQGRGEFAAALAAILPLAERGHRRAQEYLGEAYLIGRGTAPDPMRALAWNRRAAEQHSPVAQNALGNQYRQGDGVERDLVQAAGWYRRAAEQGWQYAQFNLGTLYRNGEGVSADLAEAARWFGMAAEQAHAGAQVELGNIHFAGVPRHMGNLAAGQGIPIPKDYKRALDWYRKAAEQGYPAGQNNVGTMYEFGMGVRRDPAQAESWYRKAAEKGYERARSNLARMETYNRANLALGRKDYPAALETIRPLAEAGYRYAQRFMGSIYEWGWGVSADIPKAMDWYSKAADQDDAFAHIALANILRDHQGNYHRALQHLDRAVEIGDEHAAYAAKTAEHTRKLQTLKVKLDQDLARMREADRVAAEEFRRRSEERAEAAISQSDGTGLGTMLRKGLGIFGMVLGVATRDTTTIQRGDALFRGDANAVMRIEAENAQRQATQRQSQAAANRSTQCAELQRMMNDAAREAGNMGSLGNPITAGTGRASGPSTQVGTQRSSYELARSAYEAQCR